MVKISTTQELDKVLSSSSCRAFLIYGDNSFFKREASNTIINRFLNGNKNEFSFIKFDDKSLDFEEVVAACDTAPFMSEHKCILVTDPPLNMLTDSDIESLSALLQDVPEYSTLIFYCISGEIDFKKSKSAFRSSV